MRRNAKESGPASVLFNDITFIRKPHQGGAETRVIQPTADIDLFLWDRFGFQLPT